MEAAGVSPQGAPDLSVALLLVLYSRTTIPYHSSHSPRPLHPHLHPHYSSSAALLPSRCRFHRSRSLSRSPPPCPPPPPPLPRGVLRASGPQRCARGCSNVLMRLLLTWTSSKDVPEHRAQARLCRRCHWMTARRARQLLMMRQVVVDCCREIGLRVLPGTCRTMLSQCWVESLWFRGLELGRARACSRSHCAGQQSFPICRTSSGRTPCCHRRRPLGSARSPHDRQFASVMLCRAEREKGEKESKSAAQPAGVGLPFPTLNPEPCTLNPVHAVSHSPLTLNLQRQTCWWLSPIFSLSRRPPANLHGHISQQGE